MKKALLIFTALAMLTTSATAQKRHWLLKTTLVNMMAHPSYSTSTVSASSTLDPFSDAISDENDNLLFYVSGRNVYSASGVSVASLPGFWEPPSINDCTESMDAFKRRGILNKDLLIVPVPKACKKYYLIYSLMPTAMGSNSLVYVTIDVSSGTPVLGATTSAYYPGCGIVVSASLIHTFCCNVNSVQAAASKVYNTTTGNRYLFATGRGGVRRFDITATGIGSGISIASTASAGGIFTSDDDFMAGDMDLSPDQTRLTWTPNFSNSNKSVYMISLSGYNFSSAKKFTNTLAVGGIEFNPGSSSIYITNNNGIQTVPVSAASGTSFTTAVAGAQYAASNLEIGYSNLLYVVNGTTQKLEYRDLVTPSSSGATTITVTSSASYSVTEFNLPNQVDGENYQYFSGANPLVDNLISKDDNLDIGAEENLQSANIWESPDIFNCRSGAGTCTSHENPGYLSPGLGNNYMRVRIKNIGCFNSHPSKVRMYWTMGSTGETWPNSWNGVDKLCGISAGGELINPSTLTGGIDIPVLTPGQEAIATLPWDPIDPDTFSCMTLNNYSDGNPMICLLGRIESSYDPMYSEVFGPIGHNVKFNNNIVTRNTSLVPLVGSKVGPGFGGRVSILVHNYLESAAFTTISFGSANQESAGFGAIGNIEVTLGSDLWAEWAAGGFQGQGVQIINPEQHSIRIADLNNAQLQHVLIPPDAHRSLSYLFYIQNATGVVGEYSFRTTQTLALFDGQVEEGSECHFLVRVKEEEEGDQGGDGTLEPINKLINITQQNGISLFPNPTNGVSTLTFNTSQKGLVSINVQDLNGRVVKHIMSDETMTQGTHEVNISSEELNNGMYMIQLITPEINTSIKMSIVK
jgi:hypothetical protein